MAKPVDLRQQKTADPKMEALRQRAVGAPLRQPPPARAPQLAHPLPTGSVTTRLTPYERSTLEAIGWQEGQPIPDNVAELAATIQQESSGFVAPVAETTPPLEVETVDISSLTPESRVMAQQHIQETMAAHMARPTRATAAPPDLASVLSTPPAASRATAAPAATPPPRRAPVIPESSFQPVPGVKPQRPVMVPNPKAYPDLRRQQVVAIDPVQEEVTGPEDVQIDMDVTTPDAPVPEMTTAPAAEEPGLDAFSPMTNCPHCNWLLSMPDIPEPAFADKQGFLQSVLGQKPWQKDFVVLGGHLRLRMRTLTTKEIDIVFKQVARDKAKGLVLTDEDFWELVNRYRLYLQTVSVVTTEFNHQLPDGYDAESNPYAEAHWQFDPPATPEDTALPVIADYITREVYRTETIQRMATRVCGQFNRLVAKMEAMIDDSDFWQPTGEQS